VAKLCREMLTPYAAKLAVHAGVIEGSRGGNPCGWVHTRLSGKWLSGGVLSLF
jgi:hypothetical protein